MMLMGHQRTEGTSIEFGAEQVVLVRDEAARRQLLDHSLGQSVIVLTVVESKGLEFDDVLLWDFSATRHVRRARTAAVRSSGVRCMTTGSSSRRRRTRGATRLRTLLLLVVVVVVRSVGMGWERRASGRREGEGEGEERTNRIPGPPPRRLPFDRLKHKLLESELKALYCAITRARVNGSSILTRKS